MAKLLAAAVPALPAAGASEDGGGAHTLMTEVDANLVRFREQLRALERRARAKRRSCDKVYSRRELEKAINEKFGGNSYVGRRLSDWLPKDGTGKIPRDADAVWELVQVLAEWAGEKVSQQHWARLVEAAQSAHRVRPEAPKRLSHSSGKATIVARESSSSSEKDAGRVETRTEADVGLLETGISRNSPDAPSFDQRRYRVGGVLRALENFNSNPEAVYYIGQTVLECEALLDEWKVDDAETRDLLDEITSEIDDDTRRNEGLFDPFVSVGKIRKLRKAIAAIARSRNLL